MVPLLPQSRGSVGWLHSSAGYTFHLIGAAPFKCRPHGAEAPHGGRASSRERSIDNAGDRAESLEHKRPVG